MARERESAAQIKKYQILSLYGKEPLFETAYELTAFFKRTVVITLLNQKPMMQTADTLKKNQIVCFFICALFVFLIVDDARAQSSNTKSAQWKSAGGEMLLSGKQEFKESWTSSTASREKGLYWQGSLYDHEEDRNYQPWENTVKNSVAPVVGEITVVGPGNVGLFQRGKGARITMVDKETKKSFAPWTSSISWNGKNWSGSAKAFNPKGEFWGAVGAGHEITLEISAVMSAYNNAINTGEYAFHAPQEVEYEVWFFPQDGGSVINVSTSASGIGKPQPGILYYKMKDCN